MRVNGCAALLVALGVCPAFGAEVKISADHADALYGLGEEATFTVRVTDDSGLTNLTSGAVTAELDNFGSESVLPAAAHDLARGNPFTVKGTLAHPGFLRLVVRGDQIRGKSVHWSVGYAPEKIARAVERPADFDAFWEGAVAKYDREIPAKPKVELVPEKSRDKVFFFRIAVDAPNGRQVHGYFSIPKDGAKAPFPVRVQVAAAGCGNWTNVMWPEPDAITAFFAVYPHPPTDDLKEAQRLYDRMNEELAAKWGAPRYCMAGIRGGREDYFFYPVILGLNRAVNWLRDLPEADKTNFTYGGTSQGGGLGLALVGLNGRFTRAAFFVPALTGLLDFKAGGRASGWPQLAENLSAAEDKAAVERWAPYFDGANFASRIRCPVRVVVGLSDCTCPPHAVYSAFNSIPVADKAIERGIGMGHGVRGDLYGKVGAWQRAGK